MRDLAHHASYRQVLADIKQRVRHAQTRAVMAVNAELIRLYWEIGALIDARQKQEGWGAGVIPALARDLHNELPEEKGFSERNIKRMLAFFREYPHLEFVPQAVAQISANLEETAVSNHRRTGRGALFDGAAGPHRMRPSATASLPAMPRPG